MLLFTCAADVTLPIMTITLGEVWEIPLGCSVVLRGNSTTTMAAITQNSSGHSTAEQHAVTERSTIVAASTGGFDVKGSLSLSGIELQGGPKEGCPEDMDWPCSWAPSYYCQYNYYDALKHCPRLCGLCSGVYSTSLLVVHSGAVLHLASSIITQHLKLGDGGGIICNDGAEVVVSHTAFVDLGANGHGGAIFAGIMQS